MTKASTSLAMALCLAGTALCYAAQAHAQQVQETETQASQTGAEVDREEAPQEQEAQAPETGATEDPGEPPQRRVTQEERAPETGATEDPGEPPAQASDMADVPRSTCRPGYFQQGFWLCMTGTRGPNSFANAALDCADSGGRVADYDDWRFRIFRGDGLPAPVGWWLGPITADNRALFVNQANVGDYDGETSRFDSRNYACAHNLLR